MCPRDWWSRDLYLDVCMSLVYAFVTQACLCLGVFVTLCGFVLVFAYLCIFVFVYRSQCISVCLCMASVICLYVTVSL